MSEIRKRKRQISIRVDDAEHAFIQKIVAKSGMANNEFVLHLIRKKISQVVEIRNERLVSVCEKNYELMKRQANNLNQIAKKINNNGSVSSEDISLIASMNRNLEKLINLFEDNMERSQIKDCSKVGG